MTTELSAAPATQDDRVMAALAHVSIVLPLMGVIVPILIWVTQKDKSRYVAFQALQAAVFQLALIVAWLGGMACYMLSFFATFAAMLIGAPLAAQDPNAAPFLFMPMLSVFLPFGVMGLMALAGLAWVAYGLAGAMLTLQGRDFRYAFLGRRLEAFLAAG